ncbi:MAG: hypothetical protein HWE14_00880 [Flavobacteriia bacterium]|nr:hypothetical protein [Flavobacteriia bacterium]
MKKVYGLLLVIFLFNTFAQAQNTERIKVMTYNLLNYRNSTNWCDGTNNSSSQKDGYLETIVDHVSPHVLICQEVGANSGVPTDRILTNALNTNGVNYWAKAMYTNNSFSDLVNAAFYDTRYVGLHSQSYISVDGNNQSLVRVIDFYRFYYKDSLLGGLDPDTTFFTVVGVHLKAGSNTSDANQRNAATLATMQYIQTSVQDDNVILCGDLNINTGASVAFQNIVNYSVAGVRLYDPVNEVGNWYNDYGSRYIHTQSTRLSNTNNGCFSGGGMDDRYDHILVSDEILNGAEGIEYVVNSFQVIGNDGEHFNEDITDGVNLSVPANVLTALHGMSDHLPVILEMDIEKKSVGVTERQFEAHQIRIVQLTEDLMRIEWPHNLGEASKLEIVDLNGRTIMELNPSDTRIEMNIGGLPNGLLFARVSLNNGQVAMTKFIKR